MRWAMDILSIMNCILCLSITVESCAVVMTVVNEHLVIKTHFYMLNPCHTLGPKMAFYSKHFLQLRDRLIVCPSRIRIVRILGSSEGIPEKDTHQKWLVGQFTQNWGFGSITHHFVGDISRRKKLSKMVLSWQPIALCSDQITRCAIFSATRANLVVPCSFILIACLKVGLLTAKV